MACVSRNAHPTLPIIWRSDGNPGGYEKARIGRLFNHRRPARFPVAVVEASEEAHIVDAVRLANKCGHRISIRSGGHSWAAWSVRDEAILIDLGNYHQIDYNKDSQTVAVSPSTTGKMLNTFLQTKGRMFSGGHCPDVGLGGFLLQGGMGWVAKSWGWACESVIAIDVVTAEGEQMRCDTSTNADLFWAARGAGPGFPAVVTRFHLQTRPSYSHIRTSAYVYPVSSFREAITWISKISAEYDHDTEIVCVGAYSPNSYELNRSDISILVLFTTFKQSEEDARAALHPAEADHPPGAVQQWFCQPTTLEDEYVNQARANPQGHRYCSDNAYICNDADIAEVLEEAFTTLPSRSSYALWYSMAPVSRRPLPDMALSLHTDHYFSVYSIWEDERDDAKCRGWVQSIMRGVEQHSEGSYLGDADFQIRRTRFWEDQHAKKLMEIRRKYDPNGIVCGYLDEGDKSGPAGLKNIHEWQ